MCIFIQIIRKYRVETPSTHHFLLIYIYIYTYMQEPHSPTSSFFCTSSFSLFGPFQDFKNPKERRKLEDFGPKEEVGECGSYLLIDKFTIVYLFFHSLFFVVTQSITEACRKHGAACTSSRRFRSNTPWRTSTTCSSSVITVALLQHPKKPSNTTCDATITANIWWLWAAIVAAPPRLISVSPAACGSRGVDSTIWR